MTIELTLKPRGMNSDGDPRWHDRAILENAINHIAKGKSISDLSLWIGIAAKIEQQAEAVGYGKRKQKKVVKAPDGREVEGWLLDLPEFSVRLNNTQQRKFWEELVKIPVEAYLGGQVSELGLLTIMLRDIAQQFGEKCPYEDSENE